MSVISGLKTNAVTIGTSNTDTNNFQLRSNADGTATLARKSDGSGGDVLTIDGGGIVTLASVPKVTAVQSMVRLVGSNGFGTTNTAIWRFTTTVTNQGTDITYAASAANGDTFTVNTNGVYAITYTNQFNTAASVGVSLNATGADLTTVVQSLAASKILSILSTGGASYMGIASWTGYLPTGSVVMAHNNPSLTAGTLTAAVNFTIVRVS